MNQNDTGTWPWPVATCRISIWSSENGTRRRDEEMIYDNDTGIIPPGDHLIVTSNIVTRRDESGKVGMMTLKCEKYTHSRQKIYLLPCVCHFRSFYIFFLLPVYIYLCSRPSTTDYVKKWTDVVVRLESSLFLSNRFDILSIFLETLLIGLSFTAPDRFGCETTYRAATIWHFASGILMESRITCSRSLRKSRLQSLT